MIWSAANRDAGSGPWDHMFLTFTHPPQARPKDDVAGSTPHDIATGAPVVLVVEDNLDHALLVQVAAARIDAAVVVRVLTKGEDAVAYLEGRGGFTDRSVHPLPGLMILDLLLPGMGGFDLLTWIGDRPALAAAMPVVVLTSSANPVDHERARALGAVDVHAKPADVAALGERIRGILEEWAP